MDTALIIQYLSDLKANNEKEWFHANKKQYDRARAEMESLLRELMEGIAVFDPLITGLNPKDLMFRINRDTRFGKDKSPYHTSFRAHISAAGRLPIPAGYYISIDPDRIFLGEGVFASQFPSATTMMRDYLSGHGDEFLRIIGSADFQSHFTVLGEALKNVPQGYDKEHPCKEYLKHKSWDLEYDIRQELFLDSKAFVKETVHIFELMKPFNDYINTAMAGFTMPERP